MTGQVGGTHYQDNGGIEPFAVWDAWNLNPYCADAVKYIFRAGRKPGVKRSQDLRKAEHCLREAAERAERMEERGHPAQPKSFPVLGQWLGREEPNRRNSFALMWNTSPELKEESDVPVTYHLTARQVQAEIARRGNTPPSNEEIQ